MTTDSPADRDEAASATEDEAATATEDEAATATEDEAATATDDESTADGDTFGVGIHVTESEFRFVVHVPAEIDSGWTDPDAFQRQIETYTWEELDKRETLGAVAETATDGETVTLGTVTMQPDGSVTTSSLSPPKKS
jgi:hypothetical protein